MVTELCHKISTRVYGVAMAKICCGYITIVKSMHTSLDFIKSDEKISSIYHVLF